MERLRKLSFPRRHPRSFLLSQYLDGELGLRERHALEAHLSVCDRCRGLLDSLALTVRSLGSLRESSPTGVAESVVAALRVQRKPEDALPGAPTRSVGSQALTLVPGASKSAKGEVAAAAPLRSLGPLLRYCLRRPQLRFTLPIAIVAGVALSLINQGYMILNGRVDVGMCVVCGLNLVIPFIALNVGLLLATRVVQRSGL